MRKLRLEHNYLRDMKRKIETGKYMPLDSIELDYLSDLLENSSFEPDFNKKIWSIVFHSHPHLSLLKIARNIVLQSASNEDDVFKNHAEIAFCYYLEKSSQNEQHKILHALKNCKSPRLRMIISEFHIEKGDIKTGLHLMAEILNDIGTDHALYDSIMIWMYQRATSDLKNEFLQKAKNERAKGNIHSAKKFEWICNNFMSEI